MNKTIYKIYYSEISASANTLKMAFADDPLMMWVFGNKNHYLKTSQKAIETWVKYCVYYGLAYRTEKFESIALRKLPGDIHTSWWRILRSGMFRMPGYMGKESFKRLMYFDKLSEEYKEKLMKERPFLYCWQLGTKPEYQQQGFGRLLMDIPITLEDANYANFRR